MKDATNASIADRLDIHRSTVGKWFAKGDQISIEELNKVAYALDLPDWTAFLRPPGYESVDDEIQGAPALHKPVLEFVKRLKASQG